MRSSSLNPCFLFRAPHFLLTVYYLIIEDVITTGGSFLEVAKLIEARGGKVVMVSSFIDRTNGKTFDYPFISLISLEIPSYDSNELPEFLKNISPVKPGSRLIPVND